MRTLNLMDIGILLLMVTFSSAYATGTTSSLSKPQDDKIQNNDHLQWRTEPTNMEFLQEKTLTSQNADSYKRDFDKDLNIQSNSKNVNTAAIKQQENSKSVSKAIDQQSASQNVSEASSRQENYTNPSTASQKNHNSSLQKVGAPSTYPLKTNSLDDIHEQLEASPITNDNEYISTTNPEDFFTADSLEELEELKLRMEEILQSQNEVNFRTTCNNFLPVGNDNTNQPEDALDRLDAHLEEIKAQQDENSEEGNPPISYLPDGCYAQDGIHQNIVCFGPNVTMIPEFSIRKVYDLEFTNTAIFRVDGQQIDNLPRTITRLSFTDGVLNIFDGRNLKYIENLETLSLKNNFLENWSFSMVFENDMEDPNFIHSIRYLDLQDNYMTYPPDPQGTTPVIMPYLETVGLDNNPLYYLPEKLLKPLRNCPVKRLFMKNCSLCDFTGSPLSYMPHLEVLDLSSNSGLPPERLSDLLHPLHDFNLRELYLSQNNFQHVPWHALAAVGDTLEKLDLHGSSFRTLDNSSFPHMPNLTVLDLMYSRIYWIKEDAFTPLPALQELHLDGNFLTNFPVALLLPSLKQLSLKHNPTYTGTDSTPTFNIGNVNFTIMKNLLELSLDTVQIGDIKANHFEGLHNLRQLSLTDCGIYSIDPYSFRTLSKLEELNLDGNHLSLIYNETFSGLASLKTLSLRENKGIAFFSRDVVSEVLDGTNSTSSTKSYAKNFLDALGVGEIPLFYSTRKNLPYSQTSNVTNRKVLYSTAGHIITREDLGKEATAYFPFGDLTKLESLYLSGNQIKALDPDIFKDLLNLRELDLSNNQINQWYQRLLANSTKLQFLYLSQNSITALTDAVVADFSMEALEVINLKNNDLVCNCSLSYFNYSLDSSIFTGFSSYVCLKGHKYYNVSLYVEALHCPTQGNAEAGNNYDVALGNIIAGIVLVPAVLLTMSILVYKRRWYIRYVMSSMKQGIWRYKEDDEHYLYDTFVCYSQSDRQWVFEYLLAKLEDVAKYRVCVHERDFTVGQEITDNIIQSVEKSRKVIVVLTPAFVASTWCMFELETASNKILDEGRSKLILVLLEPIPLKSQTKKLRLLLNSRTYISWEKSEVQQKYFWTRLFRAIAKPSSTTNTDADGELGTVSKAVEEKDLTSASCIQDIKFASSKLKSPTLCISNSNDLPLLSIPTRLPSTLTPPPSPSPTNITTSSDTFIAIETSNSTPANASPAISSSHSTSTISKNVCRSTL